MLLAMMMLTPFALKWWAPQKLQWSHLSDVSQTYAAVSIPLSGAALLGVVWSLIMQARQLKITNDNEFRAAHRELIMQALQDPALQECWEPPAVPTTQTRARQILYINIIFSNWRVDYLNGTASEEAVQLSAQSVMKGEIAREFWQTRRALWHAWARTQGRKDRRFVEILDEALKLSDAAGPPIAARDYFTPEPNGEPM
ncbi:DUF6082 family protein [Streptomyces sp. NPDC005485]|uniref:DUF6082 family protein n=1 Tax=Streptomyces sp. NPDC005485 TaxID=3155591 RepID=UPI00339E5370